MRPLNWKTFAAATLSLALAIPSFSQNNALDFDGVDDYARVTTPFTGFTDAITVEGWVNFDGGTNFRLAGQGTGDVDNMADNVFLFGDGGDTPIFYVNNGGSWVSAAGPSGLSGWHHVAGVADGTSTRVYVDGVQAASSGPISSVFSNPSAVLDFGKDVRYPGGTSGRCSSIPVDEVRIWNIARSELEIQAAMNTSLVGNESGLVGYWNFDEGTGTTIAELSGNSGDATWFGTGSGTTSPLWQSSSVALASPASSISMNGSTDFISGSGINLANSDFTVEGWFNTTTTGMFFSLGSTSADDQALHVRLEDSFVRVGFLFNDQDIPWTRPSGWHHLAVTHNTTTLESSVYVDGQFLGSGTHDNPFIGDSNYTIGRDSWSESGYFTGELDDIRVWNSVRTASDIAANYDNELDPSLYSDLVSYFDFSTGSGTTVFDTKGGFNGTFNGSPTWSASVPSVDAAPEINLFNLEITPTSSEASVGVETGSLADLFYVITTTSDIPSTAQILAGQDHTGSPAYNYSSYGGINGHDYFSVGNSAFTNGSDLLEGTTYYIHWLADTDGVDGGNQSEILTQEFTTIVLPSVDINTVAVPTDILEPGSLDNLIYKLEFVVTGADAEFGGLFLTPTVNDQADFDNFNFYLSTDVDDFEAAKSGGHIGSTGFFDSHPSGIPDGSIGILPDPALTFVAGTTTYIYLTADVASGAVDGHTLSLGQPVEDSNFGFGDANQDGIDLAGSGPYSIQIPENALDFDGTNDFVDLYDGILPLSGPYTFETWFNAETLSLDGTFSRRIASFKDGATFLDIAIDNGGQIAIKQEATEIQTAGVVTTSTWYHLALVYDGVVHTIYLDGIEIPTVGGGITTNHSGTSSILGGSRDGGTLKGNWNGQLENLRLWNMARTQSEIVSNANAIITAGSIASYDFNQVPGSSVLTDLTTNGNDGLLTDFDFNGTSSDWITSSVPACLPGSVFTGAFNDNWLDGANWCDASPPSIGSLISPVFILEGIAATTEFNTGSFGLDGADLIISAGASLNLTTDGSGVGLVNGARIINYGTLTVGEDLTLYDVSEIINYGEVSFHGTMGYDGGGDITVASGSIFKSSGTINGNLIIELGGIHAPGASPGCNDVAGDYTNGGTLQVEIEGLTPCTEYDQVTATGNADITGATLDLVLTYSPTFGDEFLIIDAVGTLTGTFVSDNLPADWSIEYNYPNAGEVSLVYGLEGPGGVFTDLSLWLKADTDVTGTSQVSQWDDQSGGGLNAVQGTSANQPALLNGTLNYNPVIRFDGTNDNFTVAYDIGPTNTPDLTTFVVFSSDQSASSPIRKVFGHDNGAYHRSIGLDTRATENMTYFGGSGVGDYFTLAASEYYVSTTEFTTSSFTGYVNGLLEAGPSVVSNGDGLSTLSIGAVSSNAGGSEFWDGDIAEFVVYSGTLTSSERLQVESYLAIKYGITLSQVSATDYLASDGGTIWDATANSSFSNDLVVIGRDNNSTLDQKQSTSQNSGSILSIGLGGIASDNASNANAFASNYLFLAIGDDAADASYSGVNTSDIPSGMVDSRLARVWIAEENYGDVGNVTLQFDITGLGFPGGIDASNFELLVDADGTFNAGASNVSASSFVGDIVQFDNVNLADAEFFTLGFIDPVIPPTAPTNVIAYASSETDVTIEWVDATDETSYTIESADDYAFSTNVQTVVSGLSADAVFHTFSAGTNTPSFYRVTAVNGSGATSSEVEFATTESFPGYALDLDGDGDWGFANTGGLSVTGEYTIEAWVKPETTNAEVIFSTRNSVADFGFDLQLTSGNTIHADIGNGSSWITTAANVTYIYTPGQWMHIACVVTSTGYTYYVNGVNVGSDTFSGTPVLLDASRNYISIGAVNETGGNIFTGEIDEVKVWNYAKTDFSDRFGGLFGNEAGLVAYYPFDENTGTLSTVVDRSTNANDGSLVGDAAFVTSTVVGVSSPNAPSDLTVTSQTVGSISLSWVDNASDETGFVLERSVGTDDNYTTLTNPAADAVSFVDNTVAENTLYFYRVKATNGNGDSDYSNELSVHSLTTPPSSISEVQKIVSSDGTSPDNFGNAVSISGDYAIVGSPLVDDGGTFRGAAYIFHKDGSGNWSEVAKLTASDAADQDRFASSVSISGDVAVVGVYLDDDAGNESGSAYVFSKDQGGVDNWGQVQKLTASDAAANDRFGYSVSNSGNVVVVGAYLDDDNGSNSGSAYIFTRDEGGVDNWGESQKISSSDGTMDDFFGYSVSISGNTLVVGAYGDDGAGSDYGSAYIFSKDGVGTWTEFQKVTAPAQDDFDRFGISVAISGNTAVVGANLDDDIAAEGGAVYVFGKDQGGIDNWGQVQKITASDGAANDEFGEFIAISGDFVVVGTQEDDDAGTASGSAYIFQKDEGGLNNWGEVQKLAASDAAGGDRFGNAVDISGGITLVGSYSDDDNGSDSGSAYFFGEPVLAPPTAPTELIAYASSSSDITLQWTDAIDEESYTIESADDYGFTTNVQIVVSGLSADAGFYTYSAGVDAGSFYRVTAINGSGTTPSEVEFATTELYPGYALTFDGFDDLVDISDASLPTGNSDHTFEAWVYRNSQSDDRWLAWWGNAIPAPDEVAIIGFDGTSGLLKLHRLSGNDASATAASIPVGVWTHLAVSYNGSTTSSDIYIDGNYVETIFNGGALNIPSSPVLQFGTFDGDAAYTLDGQLDEVKIWDFAKTDFSDREIPFLGDEFGLVAYYPFDENTGSLSTTLDRSMGNSDGVLMGDANFTVNSGFGGATVPEINIKGTVSNNPVGFGETTPSTFNDTDFGTTDPDLPIGVNFTIENTGTGDLEVSAISVDGDFSIIASLPQTIVSGSNYSFDVVFESSFVGYQEGTVSIASNDPDENPFTFVVGAEVIDSPPANPALSLDGVDEYIDLQTPILSTSDGSQDYTIEFWVKTTATTGVLFSQYLNTGDGSDPTRFNLSLQGDGSLVSSKGENEVVNGITSISDDNWHHVALVKSSGFYFLYIDGTLDDSGAFEDTLPFSVASPLIGTQILNGSVNVPFEGAIDDFRIWEAERTFSDINTYMFNELSGSESGLIAYYPINEGVGNTMTGELTGFSPDGILTNMEGDEWVEGPLLGSPISEAEINVKGQTSNNPISSGETVPQTFNDTDFGSTDSGIETRRTFVIENTGDGSLNVSNISVSGDFYIDAVLLPTDITTGSSLTFDVAFISSSEGYHEEFVVIENSDSDEDPYTFAVGVVVNSMGGGNYALDFDETNDYVTIPVAAPSGSMTLEAWVYSRGGGDTFDAILDFDVDNPFFGLENGQLTLYNVITDPDPLPQNEWVHVAFTLDDDTDQVTLYVNGAEVAGALYAGNFSGGPAGIGSEYDAVAEAFNGVIDEVRIWNVARSLADIQAAMVGEISGLESGLVAYYNFNEGSGDILNDITGNGNDGSLSPGFDTVSDWVSGAVFSGPTQNLSMTYPVGGESIEQNSTIAITWDATNFQGWEYIEIEFSGDGGSTYESITSNSESLFNGQYLWFVDENLVPVGSNYSVRVRADDYGLVTESGLFSVVSPGVESITVLEPNGGEVIQQNTGFEIKFTTSGLAGTEPLDFEVSSDGGSSWSNIGSADVQGVSGVFYAYALDSEYPVGSNYLVRVRKSDNSVMDQSDATFEIAPPPPPSIFLSTPNGGELIEQNSTVSIYWGDEYFDGTGIVTIEYSADGGSSYSEITTGNYEDFYGQYQWFVDEGVYATGTQYRIRVTIDGVSDESDNDFEVIVPTSPESIVILTPYGGETIQQFDTYGILFNTTNIAGSELLDIEYSDDGGSSWNLLVQADVASLSGKYNWLVDDSYLPGFDYMIRIVKNSDAGVFGISESTFVIEEGFPSATLTFESSPLSDANVLPGEPDVGIYNFRMQVADADATTIGMFFTFAGTFSASDFVTDGFRLYHNIGSDDFGSATMLTTGSLDPAGGGEFDFPPNNVAFFFEETYFDGQEVYFYVVVDIAGSAAGGNSFSINAPTSENFGFLVEHEMNTEAMGQGALFSIQSIATSLEVLVPNGGETYEAGSIEEISWSDVGMGPGDILEISHSSDGGSTFNLITSGTVESLGGSFFWTVPDEIGSNNVIQIENTTTLAVDVSDGPFTINEATGILAPAIQATGIGITAGIHTADLSWTNGDGEGRIVAVSENVGGFPAPTDDITFLDNSIYASGDNLGDGWFVVYNGTEESVTISGLAPDTQYNVAVLEYNLGSGGQVKYNTSESELNPNSFASLPLPNSSMDFDGVDDFVEIAYDDFLNLSRTFSLEAYVMPDIAGDHTGFSSIIDKRDASTNESNFSLSIVDGTDVGMFINNGTESVFRQVSGVVTPGEWSLLSVTYDGTTLVIYVDGVEHDRVESAIPYTNLEESIFIGQNAFGDERFDGELDEVRIWTNVQKVDDIISHVGVSLTGNEFGLIAYYDFNDGVPNEDNTSVGFVANKAEVTASRSLDGNLNGFALTGSESNFILSTAFDILSTTPGIQATNISVPDPDYYTADILWVNGDGERRIVAITDDLGEAFPALGSNQYYFADAEYGRGDLLPESSWRVVYNGVGSAVSVSGLEENTTYQVAVIEANGPAGFESYASGAATGNPATFATDLIQPIVSLNSIALDGGNIRQGKKNNLIYKFSMEVEETSFELQAILLNLVGSAAVSDFESNGFKLYQVRGIDAEPDFESTTELASADRTSGPTFFLSEDYRPGDVVYFYVTTDVSETASPLNEFNFFTPTTDDFVTDVTIDASGSSLSAGANFVIEQTPNVTYESALQNAITDELEQGSTDNYVYRFNLRTDLDLNVTGFTLPFEGSLLGSDITQVRLMVNRDESEDVLPTEVLATTQVGISQISFDFNEVFAGPNVQADTLVQFWVALDVSNGAVPDHTFTASPEADDLTFSDIVFVTGAPDLGAEAVVVEPDIYCDPENSNDVTVGPIIENVEFLTIQNNTGADSDDFYNGYTEQVAGVLANTTHDMNLTLTSAGAAFVKVWVDWNQDLEFNDADELVVDNASYSGAQQTLTLSISIPSTPELGLTRMRIYTYSANERTAGACNPNGGVIDGQVEDYTLSVLEPSGPTIATVATNVGYFQFTANWAAQPGASFYRLDIADDPGFTNLLVENAGVTDNKYAYSSNLLYDKSYYYRVRVVYPASTSGNSNVVEARTLRDPYTAQDSVALRTIYDATGGNSWSKKDGWFESGVRLSNWEGVSMTGTRVTSLDLHENGLTGNIPNNFQHANALKQLQTLDLSGNTLYDLGAIESLEANLQDLNISDNQLVFDDIEPWFTAMSPDVSTFTYHPQKPVGTFDSDTIPRGDSYELLFNVISADTYQWNRNGEAVADVGEFAGTTTNELTISDVNFETMGDFTVDMTDNDIPGLTLTSERFLLLAYGGIQLNVSDLRGLPLDEGTGYLLKIEEPGQPFDTIDVVSFFDGDLFFDVTILGDYVIPVRADPEVYLPTYYRQTFLWEEADTLEFRNVSLEASMAMTAIPGPLDPNDEGVIAGILELEVPDEEGSRLDGRRRQKGTRCHVRRRSSSGREDQDVVYTLIASIETDDNGEFAFPNLPEGTYRINFEYPGVPMDPNSFVEFEVGPPGSDNAEINIGALIAESGSIIVEQILPVGVKGDLIQNVKVYPNPVENSLKVDYTNLNSSSIQMQLYNIEGRVVHQTMLPKADQNTTIINVSELGSGLYILNMVDLEDNTLVKTFKILIRK